MAQPLIPDNVRSEEHLYDKRFIKRWADRCFEIKNKNGQAAANAFAKKMFSRELLAEINAEIRSRKKKNGKR